MVRNAICIHILYEIGQRILLNCKDIFHSTTLTLVSGALLEFISIKCDFIFFILLIFIWQLYVCVCCCCFWNILKASAVFSIGIDAREMWTGNARLYPKSGVSDSFIEPKWNIKWRIGFIYQRHSSIYPNAWERKSATLDK